MTPSSSRLLGLSLVALAAASACSSSESSGNGGHTATTSTTSTGTGSGGSGGSGGGATAGDSVLQHHKNASRDGLYVQPTLTKAAAATIHRDPAFNATTQGRAYAQPLFLDGGPGGKDLLFVATEENDVYALDAATGATVWQKQLGTPVALGDLPCGNIDPLGITGTPVIDAISRTLYLDAMTTPDGGSTKKHLIFALSIDDGSTRAGWPVDVSATVTDGPLAFESQYQNQRGALLILGDTLYVPYGGHWGDCGPYHGWVVGVPLANSAAPKGWATRAVGGGAWAPGGVSSDGVSVFVATGNTFGATNWSDGEAIIRLAAGPTFSQMPADYFAPTDWKALDAGDVDIGGSGPVLFDVPGATPSALAVALGKNGMAYLLDQKNLGGVGPGVASDTVANGEIIQAAAAYRTSQGSYVVFKGPGSSCPNGNGGDVTALRIGAASPPTITTAWCATQNGEGSPMVTTTDGTSEAIVWGIGAEGDNRLHAFDADTGAELFDGGGANDAMIGVRRFSTPIAAKGRIYAVGNGAAYAFVTQ